ncbi:RNA-binding protein [Leptolyngbya sp. FACHB-711]|jgi:RNA recognition motif-containing protein|uniref:RNA recognition motif domain-containing protein n=1 Tax=unclassified Leptolyngbya TaxID=2650499 RepID=UPI0016863423|nr:RNA-binding protein [Leptolyngbya sp. FACHB-711]MBD1852232.1 RNA-binding protein [Cyanobacteria bacterium FACHB-502]MBD2023604.1 RNA-binding protein [Leptolyngbya sp. FACHB-711]
MSIRLYVGNLSKELERQELEAVFAEFDDSVSTKVITDRKTGKCRGFGFVTVKSEEQADEVIEKFNGYLLKDSPIKIERAQPRTKGKEETAEQAPQGNPPSNRRSGGSKGNNKSRKVTSTEPEAVQPDPRWAQDLEKLKQLLAAQAANP